MNEAMSESLTRMKLAIPTQLAIPTHRCTKCGALWRYWTPTETGGHKGSWSLRSERAGPCCDNAPMGGQIEPLRYEHLQAAALEVRHADDVAVDRFAAAMKAKLAEKRAEGRGGWDDPEQCSTTYLATLLRSHVEKGDPLDVGNFAMMLWHRGGATNEAVDPGIPDLRLTEAQITAAAKELCQCHAEGRGADPDDEWKAYCEQFRTEAARVLRAALAAKEQPE